MKLLLVLITLFSTVVFAKPLVQVEISKVHGLVSFVHSLGGLPYSVKSYKKIYLKKYPNKNFSKLHKNLSKIYRTKIYNLIKKKSTFARSIKDLQERILREKSSISKAELREYFRYLKSYEASYHELIYDDSLAKLQSVKLKIEALMIKTNYDKLIQRAAFFYGVKKEDIPTLYLSLYPITQGNNTLAFMLDNVESIGVLVHKKKLNLEWLLSATIFHEIVHTFYKQNYDEIKQHLYRNKFIKYKQQKVFNESLATAFGAGWAFYQLTHLQSNGRWYNNKVYDKTAKKIYPLLSKYMKNSRKMDNEFVKKVQVIYKKNLKI